MGHLYNYAKAGGGTLPAAAGEVRGADVPVPAAPLDAGECHQAAKVVCRGYFGSCSNWDRECVGQCRVSGEGKR